MGRGVLARVDLVGRVDSRVKLVVVPAVARVGWCVGRALGWGRLCGVCCRVGWILMGRLGSGVGC